VAFFEDDNARRLEAGGIPAEAEERLRAVRSEGSAFTSTLGVGEFALLNELGPTPLAQVLGASVHQVGWQMLPTEAQWGGHVYCELQQVMLAWDHARRRAFNRLSEEARLVGADVVLGVELRRGEHDWARNSVDYVVSGTAVRLPGSSGSEWPVLSDLSVQDYWTLRQGGWAPVGLVAATSVFFVAQSIRLAWSRRLGAMRNQELEEYTAGFYSARERAMQVVQSQATDVGADGVVGVSLQHRVSREDFRVSPSLVSPPIASAGPGGAYVPGGLARGRYENLGRDRRKGMAITVHVVGTAIRRAAPAASGFRPATTIQLKEAG
jgi:uncharacterized protein YbjQ (UPF0145 family)